jgi:hypothetical protein
MLKEYLWEMVKMSPLQSYTLEIVEENAEAESEDGDFRARQILNDILYGLPV